MMAERRFIDVSAAIDARPIGAFQWRVVALCAVIAILDGFDTQAIAFVGPVVAAEFELDKASMGGVFAAGLAGLMAGAFLFSPLADRIGRKPVIIASCAIFGGFALATIFADSRESLMAYRFLTGLGLGGAMPNINTLTAEYAPARARATLMTVMFSGFPLGAIIGGLISTQLIAAFGWRSVFIMGGLAPLVLAPLLIFVLPESIRFLTARQATRPSQKRAASISRKLARIDDRYDPRPNDQFVAREGEPSASVMRLFSEGRASGTILLWSVFFLNLLMLYALVNWLPSVMVDAGLPLERAIVATVVLNIGGVIGGLSIAPLIDRFGPWRTLVTTYLGAAVFVAAIGWVQAGLAAMLAIVFVSGFCVIGAQLGMNAVASNYYPTAVRSTGLGWALAVGRLGSIVGPLAVGAMLAFDLTQAELFTYGALPALAAALLLMALSSLGDRRAAA